LQLKKTYRIPSYAMILKGIKIAYAPVEANSKHMKLYRQVDNKVELCILPELEKEIRKLFGKEIESGYSEELADGRIYFNFEISSEKATLLHWVSRWIENEETDNENIHRGRRRNAS